MMNRQVSLLISLIFIAGLLAILKLAPSKHKHRRPADNNAAPQMVGAGRSHPSTARGFGALPLSFAPNTGQAGPAVRFLGHSATGIMLFTDSAVVLAVGKTRAANAELLADRPTKISFAHNSGPATPPRIVKLKFIGANQAPTITPGDRLPGTVNYFVGQDRQRWRTNVPTHSGITYRELYPGVDLSYDGANARLKGTYRVAAGADASPIRWCYEGARLSTDQLGNLHVRLAETDDHGTSELTENVPVAWQEIDGRSVPVSAHYEVARDGSIGFVVGGYDPTHALIIDPTLAYSTYLGGSNGEVGSGIAVDSDGSAYITGATQSPNFPTESPIQGTSAGSADAFVAKLNPAGTDLIFSTYLGGSGDDAGTQIKIDANGSTYVCGYASSTNFPIANAIQASRGGGYDGFVAKLNPAGNALVYSTYLGGAADDSCVAMAVDTAGSAYLTGYALSPNFPTANALQLLPGGSFDAYVTKLNPAGSALVYSTFLGGVSDDVGSDIFVDGSGSAYVAGYTNSPNFPTANPFQASSAGGIDAFVTRINPAGSALVYSTFLGGSAYDQADAVAVDAAGNAFVTGYTKSTNFPTTAALQASNAGGDDAWITQLNPAGSALVFSTYLGGSGADEGAAIVLDGSGNIYIAGSTSSMNFPVVNAIQPNFAATVDAFVTKLNPAASEIIYSTYLGGNNNDLAWGIALDSSRSVYTIGYTFSTDFPTANALQPNTGGPHDAFVAKISSDISPISVVSRKVHGGAGSFDLDLPLAGVPGIECRSGGANGDYSIVFSFANTITSVGGASVISGTGSVANSAIDNDDAHNYVVNLTGVTNEQTITITLSNVYDSAGNGSASVLISMAVLIGDTTASGEVNSSDIGQTKAQSGATATSANFRTDVTINGVINSSDIALVKSKSGTAVP